MFRLLIISLFVQIFFSGKAQVPPKIFGEHIELGQVHWYRDYERAVELAKEEKKDILLLFQEVPGCATCRNYGHNVLSHPLMVEAIEDLFIPLAIFNNKGGKDREILNKFNEPAWNNPVVRIINANGEDKVARTAGDYEALTLCIRMKEALAKRMAKIPSYLDVLEQELSSSLKGSRGQTHYKMYCFWSGEKLLGDVDGVLNVESGFMGGHEVVRVTYDPKKIEKDKLDVYAKDRSMDPIVDNGKFRRSEKDIHYYLQRSDYRFLPLSKLQQVKINTALGKGETAEQYLSPRQLIWLKEARRSDERQEVLFHKDFKEAWQEKESS